MTQRLPFRNNMTRPILFLLLLCANACSFNREERLASAHEILSAIRFQETLELSKQHPPDTGASNREALNRCYQETSTTPVVEKVAMLYADVFSLDELSELKMFYLSSVGQLGIRDDIAQGYRRRRLTPPDPVVLNAEDMEKLRAFFRSSVGQKLNMDSNLQEAIAIELHLATKAMLVACDARTRN